MSDDFARVSVIAVAIAFLVFSFFVDHRFDKIERHQRETACFVRVYQDGSGDSPADVAALCLAASQD